MKVFRMLSDAWNTKNFGFFILMLGGLLSFLTLWIGSIYVLASQGDTFIALLMGAILALFASIK